MCIRCLHMYIYIKICKQTYVFVLYSASPSDRNENFCPSCQAMGLIRSVGSLKVQVSFAEYSLFYRALLQKRPIILREPAKS